MTENLVGPMPEMPKVPKYPTPWNEEEGVIYAANGRMVTPIDTPNTSEDDVYLAALIVEHINKAFEPAEAGPKLRQTREDGYGRRWFEVEPGWAIYAESRQSAEVQFRLHGSDYGRSVSELEGYYWED